VPGQPCFFYYPPKTFPSAPPPHPVPGKAGFTPPPPHGGPTQAPEVRIQAKNRPSAHWGPAGDGKTFFFWCPFAFMFRRYELDTPPCFVAPGIESPFVGQKPWCAERPTSFLWGPCPPPPDNCFLAGKTFGPRARQKNSGGGVSPPWFPPEPSRYLHRAGPPADRKFP